MLTKKMAVVRHVNDHGVLREARFIQSLQQPPELLVDRSYSPAVILDVFLIPVVRMQQQVESVVVVLLGKPGWLIAKLFPVGLRFRNLNLIVKFFQVLRRGAGRVGRFLP